MTFALQHPLKKVLHFVCEVSESRASRLVACPGFPLSRG
jgi:hypothetical protein